jgi:hypothetical protein
MPEALLSERAAPVSWFGSYLATMDAATTAGSGEWAKKAQASLRDVLTAERRARGDLPWRQASVESYRGASVAKSAIAQTNPLQLDLSLFRLRWQMKLMISQVAMHLSHEVQTSLASALDDLLDPASWHAQDPPLAPDSFATYLRLQLFERSLRLPSFGISQPGNLMAGWIAERGRLTFEFLATDQIRWSLSYQRKERRERAAGEVEINRLRDVLAPYPVLDWYIANAAAPADR